MRTQTIRGYVWVFCIYLAVMVHQLARHGTSIRPPHLERSFFYALFPGVIAPTVVMLMCLGLLKEFQNRFDKLVLTFTALNLVLSAVFALHQYEYISFSMPHVLTSCSWLIATVLLGYRVDALLKEHDKEIEMSSCSTLS